MDRKGGDGGIALHGGANVRTTTNNNTVDTTMVVKIVSRDQTSDADDDDGPYFDLEFGLPDEEDNNDGSNSVDDGDEEREDDFESDETDSEDERDFEFTLSSGSSGDRNFSLSPSDDLFFQGRLAPIEPSSMEFNNSEPNSKSQFHASLLKSASKFRAMMLKFKNLKSNVAERTESDQSAPATPKQQQRQQVQNQESQSKLFTVNLKTEESDQKSASDEKRFSEDVKQRYLKIVKPLYVRVSKRYGEKLRFSGQSPPSTLPLEPPAAGKSQSKAPERSKTPPPDNVKSRKQVSVPAGLRVVRKHLGKSFSASSVVAAAAAAPALGPVTSRRRDDSLLQQQDGIQSAILHCKRSFKASKDPSWEEGEETALEVV